MQENVLRGRTGILFGHTSQLGQGICRRLLAEGFQVVGIARSSAGFRNPNLTSISAGLLVDAEIDRVLSIIKQSHHTFDVLIYAIGGLTAHPIGELSLEDMRYVYHLNTLVPMFIESQLIDAIGENGADVVNITSSSIFEYYPEFTEYSSSKIALQKFTQDLQRRLKDTSARVIEICPSGFTSSLYEGMRGNRIDRDESIQIPADELAEASQSSHVVTARSTLRFVSVTIGVRAATTGAGSGSCRSPWVAGEGAWCRVWWWRSTRTLGCMRPS
jgi:NAD(P)-dependent dehydrogenase (short-subunit alcohol dehydrogenase family)